jgi:hypothetical protein
MQFFLEVGRFDCNYNTLAILSVAAVLAISKVSNCEFVFSVSQISHNRSIEIF